MPTYDYQCESCGHELEMFQRITEDPIKKCPACKKSKLRRLFGTGAAIMFKGSGFYETDYRSDSYKKAAKADQESNGSKSADKKSDSKSKQDSSGSKPEPKSKAKSGTASSA